jgi:MFS family permease
VAGQPLSARRRVVTLVAMCVAQGMILLDNTIVNVALPSIQRELDVNPGNLIWVVNAYVLALASLIMVGGTLGDRYGRKRVFLVGLAIFTAMSAACAPLHGRVDAHRRARRAGRRCGSRRTAQPVHPG